MEIRLQPSSALNPPWLPLHSGKASPYRACRPLTSPSSSPTCPTSLSSSHKAPLLFLTRAWSYVRAFTSAVPAAWMSFPQTSTWPFCPCLHLSPHHSFHTATCPHRHITADSLTLHGSCFFLPSVHYLLAQRWLPESRDY